MKKTIVILILGMALVLSGCFGPGSGSRNSASEGDITTNVQSGASREQPVEEAEDEDLSVEEQVVFDQDGVKVTVKGLEDGGLFGPKLAVLIENDSADSITVQARDSSVNGVMVDTIISSDVEPGKKANATITFSSSDLRTAGVEVIQEMEFKLTVINNDGKDRILSDPIVVTTTGGPSYVQTFNDSGALVMEESGIRIACQRLDGEDSFWGADIYLFVENDSGQDITIQIRDCSINGFMISPIFSCDVVDGKKAYDSITFLESHLTDNGIESIDEIEFSFHIFSGIGNTILDTEAVTITF